MVCTIIYIRLQYLYLIGGKFIINLLRLFAFPYIIVTQTILVLFEVWVYLRWLMVVRGIGPESLTLQIYCSFVISSIKGRMYHTSADMELQTLCLYSYEVWDRPAIHSRIVFSVSVNKTNPHVFDRYNVNKLIVSLTHRGTKLSILLRCLRECVRFCLLIFWLAFKRIFSSELCSNLYSYRLQISRFMHE